MATFRLPLFRPILLMAAGAVWLAAGATMAKAACTKADIVVYGGTPGGVAAAVQAGRLGKQVILIEPTNHVGGMMANGLTKADASLQKGVYGGLAAAFFARAEAYYRAGDTAQPAYESRFAEAAMKAMLRVAKVRVDDGQQIQSVERSMRAIRTIVMTSGKSYCAKVFIDASYEGDLLAHSGATTALGRESTGQYGESGAGVQKLQKPMVNKQPVDVDPFILPANPQSGLLPGVSPAGPRQIGAADKTLPPLTYRLCLTPARNRIAFTQPKDYNPLRYETTARFIAALEKAGTTIGKTYFVGNGATVAEKYDVDANVYFSTNVFSGYAYITADEKRRQALRDDVRSHILGLFWFAQTDPRVPESVRAYTAKFGLCSDEFQDNGHIPSQLYIREGRRLVGQYVLTQTDLERQKTFKDAIGLGYAAMDQRIMLRTVENGFVADDIRSAIAPGGPYQIPYRALLPNEDEVTNLLVPVALSASHVASSSLRVEPTMMVLGQAAGAAASLARDGNVNRVDIRELQSLLTSNGQIIAWK